MNGLQNDFIVFRGPVDMPGETVARLCDRETGIGADGVLVVTRDNTDPVRMDYWNADGSRAEMCGNGLRCVARFAVDHALVEAGEFIVQTPVGPLEVNCSSNPQDDVEVQVGKVKYQRDPVTLAGLLFYVANVGNPHAITFVQNTEETAVTTIGPTIENDGHFPNKTNVEFVEMIDKEHIRLRVWERGVGETQACGTGMVASAVVSSQVNKTQLPVTVEVRGGVAKVWVDEEGFARLLGPVETTGTGHVEI